MRKLPEALLTLFVSVSIGKLNFVFGAVFEIEGARAAKASESQPLIAALTVREHGGNAYCRLGIEGESPRLLAEHLYENYIALRQEELLKARLLTVYEYAAP